MSDAADAVPRFRRRMATLLFARQWLVYAAIGCLLCGVALLIAKRWNLTFPLWPALLVLASTLIAAAWHAARLLPSRAATIALIDAQSNCGGLLMAQDAVDLGAWTPDVQSLPRISWRGRRQSILTAICAAFLIVAAIVPARARSTKHTLAIDADVEKLESRIDLLKEEKILPDERAETMKSTLEELKHDAEGDDPAKTWEALDSLDEATLRSAADAAGDAVRKAEELTKTEATALALTDGGLDPQALLAATADPETQKAIGDKTLTTEQLHALGASAKAQKSKMRQTLEKLAAKSLIDPKALRAFDKASALGNKQDLARFLKENAKSCPFGTAVDQWCRGAAGVSRGRGDMPMFFGDEADGGKFNEQTLPPAQAAELAQSELIGVSAAAPSSEDGARSTPGALQNAQAGGGSALTPVVQPRHRGTVQRFFERKPK